MNIEKKSLAARIISCSTEKSLSSTINRYMSKLMSWLYCKFIDSLLVSEL